MRTSIHIMIAIAGLVPVSLAQDQNEKNYTQQIAHVEAGMSGKPLVVSGRVSRDGKTLLTDIDSEWSVTDPASLKGVEGRRVTVKCYVDTERSRIQILRVKKEQDEVKYAARHDDSAFRR
jgi:hypothetical protein